MDFSTICMLTTLMGSPCSLGGGIRCLTSPDCAPAAVPLPCPPRLPPLLPAPSPPAAPGTASAPAAEASRCRWRSRANLDIGFPAPAAGAAAGAAGGLRAARVAAGVTSPSVLRFKNCACSSSSSSSVREPFGSISRTGFFICRVRPGNACQGHGQSRKGGPDAGTEGGVHRAVQGRGEHAEERSALARPGRGGRASATWWAAISLSSTCWASRPGWEGARSPAMRPCRRPGAAQRAETRAWARARRRTAHTHAKDARSGPPGAR